MAVRIRGSLLPLDEGANVARSKSGITVADSGDSSAHPVPKREKLGYAGWGNTAANVQRKSTREATTIDLIVLSASGEDSIYAVPPLVVLEISVKRLREHTAHFYTGCPCLWCHVVLRLRKLGTPAPSTNVYGSPVQVGPAPLSSPNIVTISAYQDSACDRLWSVQYLRESDERAVDHIGTSHGSFTTSFQGQQTIRLDVFLFFPSPGTSILDLYMMLSAPSSDMKICVRLRFIDAGLSLQPPAPSLGRGLFLNNMPRRYWSMRVWIYFVGRILCDPSF
ncbi:hypothetical protein P691DRAFT_851164 [Macrolepiota fuliginosa MF-IS2]|uniref:Uncharacterized protein n=1 Tax=Macrolepiota fuliginosa MF-IS2 TaxID=1400762 RepID=A0A9P5XGH9_9AGAR|nr:hypothetical protein P691DRAFT_851164 [Macrolepiota fuliginosa MF-IS2]